MTDITTTHSVDIEAPADRVWHALTTPDEIERWFFGVRTESDWREGSPIVHRGEFQGKPYEDTGEIVRIEPPTLLVHTHWSDVSGVPNDLEHHQRVTWSLEEHDHRTTLTVHEDNLPSEDAKQMSDQSWPQALGKLKSVVEGG
jgi:uncharacterized protein YndB with AHSA1/START domain